MVNGWINQYWSFQKWPDICGLLDVARPQKITLKRVSNFLCLKYPPHLFCPLVNRRKYGPKHICKDITSP